MTKMTIHHLKRIIMAATTALMAMPGFAGHGQYQNF